MFKGWEMKRCPKCGRQDNKVGKIKGDADRSG
jgi:hypothetical protein